MKVGASVKKQAGQIAKQMAEEILKEPKRVLETAGAQTGVIPQKSQEGQQQVTQDIQTAKDNDATFAGRRIREIEGELAQLRQGQQQEKRASEIAEIQMKETENQKKPKKPFFQISGGKKKKGGVP